jgi:hypothetical protein
MTRKFWLAVLAYIVPTFPIGYFWHLVVFKSTYDALQVYRPEILIPFGILSMVVQGCIWAYLYSRLFAGERWPVLRSSWRWPLRSRGASW